MPSSNDKSTTLLNYKQLKDTFTSLPTKRKILLAFSVPLSLTIMIAVTVYFSINHLIETSAWVKHTHKVIASGNELERLMIDMESGERGFLITGKDDFLTPFNQSQAVWHTKMQQLQRLVSDNPPQVERLKKIDKLQKRWIEKAANVEIAKRRQVSDKNISLAHMQKVLREGHGKKILDQLKIEIAQLEKLFIESDTPQGVQLTTLIAKALVDQETGQRGFLITGEEEFLTPYHDGINNLASHITLIRELAINQYAPKKALIQLRKIEQGIQLWDKEIAQKSIKIRAKVSSQELDTSALKTPLLQVKGKAQIDKLRLNISALESLFIKAEQPSARNTLAQITKNIVDQETSIRGFMVTGADEFLLPYEASKKHAPILFDQLRNQISKTFDQSQVMSLIEQLEKDAAQWNSEAGLPEIEARREINRSGLSTVEFIEKMVNQDQGKQKLDQIRVVLTRLATHFKISNDLKGENLVLKLSKAIVDQETSERGYLLTGNQSYLEPYHFGQKDFDQALLEINVHIRLSDADTDAEKYKSIDEIVQDLSLLNNKMKDWHQTVAQPEISTRRVKDQTQEPSIELIQRMLITGQGQKTSDNIRQLITELTEEVSATNKVAANLLAKIAQAVVNKETGQRGFLITGEIPFLQPFYDGEKVLKTSFAELTNIIKSKYDKAQIKDKLSTISALEHSWRIDAALPEISLRYKINENIGDYQELANIVKSGLGKGTLEHIKYLLSEIKMIFTQAQNNHALYLTIKLEKDIVDQETGQMGFLLTGKEEFLAPYNEGDKQFSTHMGQLSQLIDTSYDKNSTLKKITILRNKILQWENESAIPTINIRKALNKTGAQMSDVTALIERETGKKIIDTIRILKKEFLDIERELMLEREKSATQAVSLTMAVIFIGSALAVCTAIFIAFRLSNNITDKLDQLLIGTQQVTEGKLETKIAIAEQNEFGKLSSSFNKMTSSIRHAIKETEQANQAKGDFLANMSHEIRTPMSGILGTLSMLEDTSITDKQLDLIHTIRSCGDGLLVVINDILDISKLEAGKLNMENRAFNLPKCVNDCHFLLDNIASQKGLNVIVEIDDALPKNYVGDATRLRQIILNLVNNAIKFTDKGNIYLKVKLLDRNDNSVKVIFEVIDQGIGISAENQKKLFQPFNQVDNTISRKFGGTGLGLVISNQLVQLMKGNIEVKSELNKGSTFSFVIPLMITSQIPDEVDTKVKPKTAISLQVDPEAATKKPLSILIVEDNPINQAIAKNLFRKMGYQPDVANDGQEAINALENNTYNVIFMDMQMPVMDGVTATKMIFKIWQKNTPRIIAMTANVLSHDKQKCFDAGMHDFLGKPINVQHVIEALGHCDASIHYNER